MGTQIYKKPLDLRELVQLESHFVEAMVPTPTPTSTPTPTPTPTHTPTPTPTPSPIPYFPASDIILLLSGGLNNSNPNKSLGGEPAYQSINVVHGTNNLFSNLTQDQMAVGHADYRCVYVFNRNATHTLYSTQLSAASSSGSGVSVTLGCDTSTAQQGIKITYAEDMSGTFVLSMGSQSTSPISFTSNVVALANSVQTALRTFESMRNITVLPFADVMPIPSGFPGRGPIYYYTVQFVGEANHKAFPLISASSTSLAIETCMLNQGAPINAIAPVVQSDTIAPNGIHFADSPIAIGDLLPGDCAAVWVCRNAEAVSETWSVQSAQLTIQGYPLPI